MGVRQIGGMYLIAVSLAVVVYFIINSFFVANDTFDVQAVWNVLDVLMVIALPIGLALSFMDKAEERRQHAMGLSDPRKYIAVNGTFYGIVVVSILFLHNWFNLLANGADALSGDATYWTLWAVIDTLLPITLAIAGVRQLRGSSYWTPPR